MASDEAKERQIPAALLGVGVVLLAFVAYRLSGERASFGAPLVTVLIITVIRAALLLVGAFVTAKVAGVSFGYLGSAFLKLMAIAVFPDALGAAIGVPGLSWLIAMILYFVLLTYLFDLDAREALIFTVVMLVINFITGVLLRGMQV